LAYALRVACASYGSDPYARGAALGSTVVLAVLMRVASSGWEGSASESESATRGIASFLSGLLSWLDAAMAASMYAAKRREGIFSSSSSSSGGDDGGGGGGFGLGGIGNLLFSTTSTNRNNRQYDEIGDGLGFAGDFPSSGLGGSATATTIRV
jgi:hypothetical protein